MDVTVAVFGTVSVKDGVNIANNVSAKVGVAVGNRICVGPIPNIAFTVRAAAVLSSLISGSFVDNDPISAAVGGVASKNAIA